MRLESGATAAKGATARHALGMLSSGHAQPHHQGEVHPMFLLVSDQPKNVTSFKRL